MPGDQRGRQKAPQRVRQRAQELARQGMPYQMAMAVAYGRLQLSDALERMAVQEKAQRLQQEHGLSRALAVQVAKGHADLDAILTRRRMETYCSENPMRSCLDETLAAEGSLTLGLHGSRTLTGRFLAVEPYTITVAPRGKRGVEGDPVEIHKLQIKYAHTPDAWKVVKKAIRFDRNLRSNPISPIERPQDRYTSSTKRLFRYLDQELVVVATLLEGEVLRGTVSWFSRFEIGLQLKPDAEAVLFRHALHALHTA